VTSLDLSGDSSLTSDTCQALAKCSTLTDLTVLPSGLSAGEILPLFESRSLLSLRYSILSEPRVSSAQSQLPSPDLPKLLASMLNRNRSIVEIWKRWSILIAFVRAAKWELAVFRMSVIPLLPEILMLAAEPDSLNSFNE